MPNYSPAWHRGVTSVRSLQVGFAFGVANKRAVRRFLPRSHFMYELLAVLNQTAGFFHDASGFFTYSPRFLHHIQAIAFAH